MVKIKRQLLGLIALISFLTNLLWESLQPSLFEGYTGFSQHFIQCVFASIGDMVYITGLYLFFAIVFGDFFWIRNISQSKGFIVVLTGALSAVVFEKIAIYWGLWEYGDMPIIPGLEVGLLPVLQFAILPLVSFLAASSLNNYLAKR